MNAEHENKSVNLKY